jgi:hypothetical protein
VVVREFGRNSSKQGVAFFAQRRKRVGNEVAARLIAQGRRRAGGCREGREGGKGQAHVVIFFYRKGATDVVKDAVDTARTNANPVVWVVREHHVSGVDAEVTRARLYKDGKGPVALQTPGAFLLPCVVQSALAHTQRPDHFRVVYHNTPPPPTHTHTPNNTNPIPQAPSW